MGRWRWYYYVSLFIIPYYYYYYSYFLILITSFFVVIVLLSLKLFINRCKFLCSWSCKSLAVTCRVVYRINWSNLSPSWSTQLKLEEQLGMTHVQRLKRPRYLHIQAIGTTTVCLGWEAVSRSLVTYNVYEIKQHSSFDAIVSCQTPFCVINKLIPGMEYSFTIQAKDESTNEDSFLSEQFSMYFPDISSFVFSIFFGCCNCYFFPLLILVFFCWFFLFVLWKEINIKNHTIGKIDEIVFDLDKKHGKCVLSWKTPIKDVVGSI